MAKNLGYQFTLTKLAHSLGIATYKKKQVTWNSVPITVKYTPRDLLFKSSKFDETNDLARVGEVYTKAMNNLVIAEGGLRKGVTGGLPEEQWNRIDRYFLTPGHNETTINRIRGVLVATQTGLRKAFGLKVVWLGPDSGTAGYVRWKLNIKRLCSLLKTQDKSVLYGDIHINLEDVRNRPKYAAATLVHEATHRFAYTDDHGEKGYISEKNWHGAQPYRKTGLTTTKAFNNADSYTYLFRAVANWK